MALQDGYGVLIGTKSGYFRDPPDSFGRYYHGNLLIGTPFGQYHCAIDVDPKNLPDGIQWRIVRLTTGSFQAISGKSNGWHTLSLTDSSGALDYIRSSVLHPPFLIYFIQYGGWLQSILNCLRWNPPWKYGRGIDALTDLESVLDGGVRFYVFGEPFRTGLGVHNIHQNQGDPVGSPFAAENAIWQDGGTIVEFADGRFTAFLNKFKTQSFKTDNQGHPV